jgi:hypothetical protein
MIALDLEVIAGLDAPRGRARCETSARRTRIPVVTQSSTEFFDSRHIDTPRRVGRRGVGVEQHDSTAALRAGIDAQHRLAQRLRLDAQRAVYGACEGPSAGVVDMFSDELHASGDDVASDRGGDHGRGVIEARRPPTNATSARLERSSTAPRMHITRNRSPKSRIEIVTASWSSRLACHDDESLALHATPVAGSTLLHLCVDNDEIDIARWLLAKGMNVDARGGRRRRVRRTHGPLWLRGRAVGAHAR